MKIEKIKPIPKYIIERVRKAEKTVDDTDDEAETALPYSPSSFDKETMIYLYDLLDGKVDIA